MNYSARLLQAYNPRRLAGDRADTSVATSATQDSVSSPSEAKPKVLEYLPAGNDEYLDIYPCDVLLTVGKHEFPVHGGVLASQSRVFSKMLATLKAKEESQVGEMLRIVLHDALKDVELMLVLLYSSRVALNTALEAARMMFIGDKYDIPKFFRIAEMALCYLYEDLYFIEPVSIETKPRGIELLNVVPLLELADRVGLMELRIRCQYVIVRDTVALEKGRESSVLAQSMRTLELSGVNPRTMYEIAAYLIQSFTNGGIMHTQLWCSGCAVKRSFQNCCARCKRSNSNRMLPTEESCKDDLFNGLSKLRKGVQRGTNCAVSNSLRPV